MCCENLLTLFVFVTKNATEGMRRNQRDPAASLDLGNPTTWRRAVATFPCIRATNATNGENSPRFPGVIRWKAPGAEH